ncbi:MAG: SDR family NAD(P)-dependent oxidoreductase, partial [Acetobacteraceae bacterium]|nr:SDR family NAD(P)-dependent oxidoreductase [Acetobacteraceae bacterium]
WLGTIEGLSVRQVPVAAILPEAMIPAATAPDWHYALRWDVCPALDAPCWDACPAPAAPVETTKGGHWLILADRGGVAAALARRLTERGETCRTVFLDDPVSARPGSPCWRDTPNLEPAVGGLIETIAAPDQPPLRNIVHLWPLDLPGDDAPAGDRVAGLRPALGGALALVQAAVAARPRLPGGSPRLWLVTQGAQAAAASDTVPHPIAGALWGFGRSLALEHPWLAGGLVDLDPAIDTEIRADLLLREILASDGESQVALRADGGRFAPRLVRASPVEDDAVRFDPEATYLITGGLGSLGLELAGWMSAAGGARHFVLVSRRGEADPAAATARETLAAQGASVRVLAADVADADAVHGLVARIAEGGRPLRGVFHCAGLLDDGVLSQLDWSRMQRVLAPKVAGAWNLHAATRGQPLDHFVLFSSVLGLTGSAGQANYAAANTALDALAAARRAAGLPALTLNWGPWADAGLATEAGEKGRAIWRTRGTRFIDQETGRAAFGALIGGAAGQAAITLTDWPVFLQQFPGVPPFYSVLAAEAGQGRPARARTEDAARLRARLQDADETGRRAILTAVLRDEATRTLATPEPVDVHQPLRDYGLDSLMSVTLLNHLEAVLAIRLPPEALIAGPSVAALVDQLLPEMAGTRPSGPARAAAEMPPPAAGRWLVPVTNRPAARMRLFCFPFAGGGSAVFRAWKDLMDPAIELIAVEPPGRLARIREAPVRDVAEFVEGLMQELPAKLDLPYAVFGHCLGGLTGFETVRRLLELGLPAPRHLFFSGARPPDRLNDAGDFEERLTRDLMALASFQLNAPVHLQPDDVFTEVIRHFEIATSDEMLADPALRDLMLPVIRAEFGMVQAYHHVPTRPWEIPITCFAAKGDPYVARRHALGWGRFTNTRLQLVIREGKHFAVLDDKEFLVATIGREMVSSERQAW